jgi:hypothetical protein
LLEAGGTIYEYDEEAVGKRKRCDNGYQAII